MCNILHDYPDEKCIVLLKKTIEAMSEESVLIIDEIIIPNKGARWKSMLFDSIMMTSFASIERTEKQWDNLLDKARLKVLEKRTYEDATGLSIIVVVPKV
jgi:demethylsterigmatocystin 6-O-methyltransferase